MTLSVGRVGLDVSMNNPSSFDLNGDELRLSGPFRVSSVANMKTLRQQLTGYVDNPWEKTVPVTFSLDSTVDGFYRVLDASVGVPVFGYRNGYANYDLTLRRVAGYAGPTSESYLRGKVRTGGTNAQGPIPWWVNGGCSYNGYRNGPVLPGNVAGISAYTQAGERGSSRYFSGAAITTSQVVDWNIMGGAVNPATWYTSASTITQDSAVVVGRQSSSSTNWYLDNGVLKIVPSSTGFNLYLSYGSGWKGPMAVTLSMLGASYTVGSPAAVVPVILRNAPELSGVRLQVEIANSTAPYGHANIDIMLRRGATYADVNLTTGGMDAAAQWKIGHPSATTMIHVDADLGGNVDNADDANNNKLVLANSAAFTESLANGTMTGASTTNPVMYVGVGLVNSSDPTIAGYAYPAAIRSRYMAALAEQANIVLA